MTRDRQQNRGREREQQQARAREQTEKVREGLDLLDDPEYTGGPVCPGVLLPLEETGFDDELESDAVLDEGEGLTVPDCASEPEGEEPASEATEASHAPRSRRPTVASLRDVIGCRSPSVLLRLVQTGDTIEAHLLVQPRPEVAPALEELRLFVEARFQHGQQVLSAEEWGELVGTRQALLTRRLILLTSLRVRGNTVVEVPGQARFKPNDRGLARYEGKFVAFPDGLPFSIRLLLEDGQGKAPAGASDSRLLFNHLPDALQLQVLELAKRVERQGGQARADDDFTAYLDEALQQLDIPADRPQYRHVTGLRDKLKYHNLEHLFPNARTRQQEYDRATEGDSPAPEEWP